MKLAAPMVARTLDQYNARVLPDQAQQALSKRFGDHTFFIDGDGLTIIEPTGADGAIPTTGVVVNLASWNNDQSELAVHNPTMTDITVELGPIDDPDTKE